MNHYLSSCYNRGESARDPRAHNKGVFRSSCIQREANKMLMNSGFSLHDSTVKTTTFCFLLFTLHNSLEEGQQCCKLCLVLSSPVWCSLRAVRLQDKETPGPLYSLLLRGQSPIEPIAILPHFDRSRVVSFEKKHPLWFKWLLQLHLVAQWLQFRQIQIPQVKASSQKSS